MTTEQNDHISPNRHDRKVSVVRQPIGWEVREEEGQQVLRSVLVTDWHRVERAIQSFAHHDHAVPAER